MAKMSNKQILDQIRATGSAEYQERVSWWQRVKSIHTIPNNEK